jgi:hypothetical protein
MNPFQWRSARLRSPSRSQLARARGSPKSKPSYRLFIGLTITSRRTDLCRGSYILLVKGIYITPRFGMEFINALNFSNKAAGRAEIRPHPAFIGVDNKNTISNKGEVIESETYKREVNPVHVLQSAWSSH